MMPAVFEQIISIPKGAIDVHGHVNNIEYLRWMQEVAVRHSDAQGWTLDRYHALGRTWFVRSHRISYLGQGYAGDTIRILTWVATLRKSRSLRRYCFKRITDGQILARAETDWAFIDLATGRPVPVSPEVAAAFEVVEQMDPEFTPR